MGEQIDADYPDGTLHLVCILKGGCFFLADLARAIRRDVLIDFIGISSYGKGKITSGAVKLTKDVGDEPGQPPSPPKQAAGRNDTPTS